ncbi:MAG: hypothetical protein Q8O37_08765 [Sulfuricellaceae bacterium]|nr:hypothetical protein [Sulfuricellaceae bacterium]
MGDCQALLAGLLGVGVILVRKSTLDVRRPGVLALDLVGVVGVHGPQARCQGKGKGLASIGGEPVAMGRQLSRLLQQRAEDTLFREEGLKDADICHGFDRVQFPERTLHWTVYWTVTICTIILM